MLEMEEVRTKTSRNCSGGWLLGAGPAGRGGWLLGAGPVGISGWLLGAGPADRGG